MNRKLLLLAGIVIIAAASVVGGYLESTHTIRAASNESVAQDRLIQGFEEALVTVEESYAGSSDLELLGKAAIQGMLKQLDPHSAFFTKTEFDDLQTEQKSRIYGIGVTIAKRSDRVYITSVIPGAPAYRAGVRYGDAILAIDGQNAEEWTSDQVMHGVRGEKGEQVEITVERPGSAAPITLRIKRDEVKLPSVRNAFMMDQGTGYIALTGGFSSKTDEELTAALAKLKQDGMRQIILDLRGNPGGLLDQAIEVSKKFLLGGQKILEVRGREERFQSRVHEVPENNTPELMPLVLLVNRHTASASEVVAGALQDHDRALIVGENSFGKGLVQSVNRLWGGTGLTLTIAKYYTPTGRSIQRDYSNVSFYDYYLNRNEDKLGVTGTTRGTALFTDTGREVFGGGGITPDIEVKSPEASQVRNLLFFGIFDFVRYLAAGQVTALREYRISETQYKAKLGEDDIERYPVNDKVLAAFQQHISSKPQFAVSEELFDQNREYIRAQIRRELMTAAYGTEAGDQSYLYQDEQLRAAVKALDGARTLAENARRARSERQ